jgi:hypothetical protein
MGPEVVAVLGVDLLLVGVGGGWPVRWAVVPTHALTTRVAIMIVIAGAAARLAMLAGMEPTSTSATRQGRLAGGTA